MKALTQNQHFRLDRLLHLMTGDHPDPRGLVEARAACEGIFASPSALDAYVVAKLVRQLGRRAEEVESDDSWERYWASQGLPRAPFDSLWTDIPMDRRTTQYLNETGQASRGVLEESHVRAVAEAEEMRAKVQKVLAKRRHR